MENTPIDQAIALHRAGKLGAAEQLYRQILDTQPNHADALHFLGLLMDQRGNHTQAIDLIQRAVSLNPSAAHYYNNLGEGYRKSQRLDEAVQAFHQAIQLRPEHPLGWYNLGIVLAQLKRYDEAIDAYHQALRFNRQFPEAYNNLAIALAALDRHDQAIAAYKAAIETAPQAPASYMNLAMLLAKLKRHDEAISLAQKGAALNPNHAETIYNLGVLYEQLLRYAEALQCYDRAIQLNPQHALAHNNAGNIYRMLGEPDRALPLIQRSLEIHFDPNLYINLVTTLYHSPVAEPRAIREAHELWAKLWTDSIVPLPARGTGGSAGGRIRIGYVSPDFREHSVAYFLEPILAHHDREHFEIFCYSDVKSPDAVTERLRVYADTWRQTSDLTDRQLADQVRSDAVDILVDLAGHTTGSRLFSFALKPAPIQITYLGYPNTTGMKQIDYKVTDAQADPTDPPTDAFYTEKLLRLPQSFLCYRIPAALPEPGDLPSTATGHLTFGCFNPIAKINPAVTSLWAKILAAVPNSRLILKSHHFHDGPTRDLFAMRLARDGVDRDRLELITRTKTHEEHIALYNRIDIALDPFPYAGTTTTCEALAMGVPVVTLAGTSHISRVGVSILTALKLHNLIAQTPDEYVRIATTLAGDRDSLATLRATLRARMQDSPLCDEQAFTRNLEQAFDRVNQSAT